MASLSMVTNNHLKLISYVLKQLAKTDFANKHSSGGET